MNFVCRQVSFTYETASEAVFVELDLLIDTGWRCALVGRNGRGKTTLLRLLHGDLVPDKGDIERPLTTRLFPGPTPDPSLPAFAAAKDQVGPFRAWEHELESLAATQTDAALTAYGALLERYEKAGGYRIEARLEREFDGLGVAPELRSRPFGSLSGGQQTRVLLAALFAGGEAFHLIDEPTNHLDREGRAQVASYLAGKQGFLLVSHDRAFVDAAVDHVVALNADSVEVLNGNYTTWHENKQQRIARQAHDNAQLRREIASLEGTAAQRRAGAHAREADKGAHVDNGFIGARAARQMKRALAAERRAKQAAEARRATLHDVERAYPLAIETQAHAREVLTLTNLALARSGASPLFQPISLQLKPGERIAVLGPNGSGKTTLFDYLAGETEDLSVSGDDRLPGHLVVSRARQSPRLHSGALRERLSGMGLEEGRFRQLMAALGVRGEVLELPIEQLSRGQQKKIELALSLSQPADLLIWDEPLNYIDVEAREAIETAILAGQPTMLICEHDATFIDRVATGTVTLLPTQPATT